MSDIRKRNAKNKKVAVVIGATSKWQADGRNTRLAHGKAVDDSDLPVGIRWGVGGAIAQKFAQEGFFTVITTRAAANAEALAKAIGAQGNACMIVELDLSSQDSVTKAFDTIRTEAGDTLAVDPRIPDAWPGFRVALRLNDGASRYRVEVDNPSGRAAAVTAIELDGVPGRVDGGIGRVALLRDGADHAVRVRLG